MGICKCKNTTDLYCFTHDCHVCERCITDENGGHQACYVRKYVDYINDSAFTPPVCGRCHKLDDAGEGHPPLVRLPCLDVVHLECLDAIGVDATSAQSSVKCPLCGADVFPKGATRESPIMDALCEKLKDSPWAAGLVEGVQKSVMSEVPPAKSSVPKAIEVPIPPVSNNPTLLSSAATATPLTSTPSDDIQIQLNVSREDENNPTYTLDQLNGISEMSTRKNIGGNRGDYSVTSVIEAAEEDDEVKYHSHTCSQILYYFGIARESNGKVSIDYTKILLVCAILGILFYLVSLTNKETK